MNRSTNWTLYIARLATRTGRPVAEIDREEAQRIIAKTLPRTAAAPTSPPPSRTRTAGIVATERMLGALRDAPLPADLCASVRVAL